MMQRLMFVRKQLQTIGADRLKIVFICELLRNRDQPHEIPEFLIDQDDADFFKLTSTSLKECKDDCLFHEIMMLSINNSMLLLLQTNDDIKLKQVKEKLLTISTQHYPLLLPFAFEILAHHYAFFKDNFEFLHSLKIPIDEMINRGDKYNAELWKTIRERFFYMPTSLKTIYNIECAVPLEGPFAGWAYLLIVIDRRPFEEVIVFIKQIIDSGAYKTIHDLNDVRALKAGTLQRRRPLPSSYSSSVSSWIASSATSSSSSSSSEQQETKIKKQKQKQKKSTNATTTTTAACPKCLINAKCDIEGCNIVANDVKKFTACHFMTGNEHKCKAHTNLLYVKEPSRMSPRGPAIVKLRNGERLQGAKLNNTIVKYNGLEINCMGENVVTSNGNSLFPESTMSISVHINVYWASRTFRIGLIECAKLVEGNIDDLEIITDVSIMTLRKRCKHVHFAATAETPAFDFEFNDAFIRINGNDFSKRYKASSFRLHEQWQSVSKKFWEPIPEGVNKFYTVTVGSLQNTKKFYFKNTAPQFL
jgi:hypothetical protein